eukprot:TRINITY_DN3627_c0_g1_i1.p2 TRINITY_DN3627_c0_g1~~TRINITY_DN3627_c0_g1_i1.p2  ORF type:complete len:121 (-),score=0.02 TRINITY_DN3627_c0_g1_i1:180-542(-)
MTLLLLNFCFCTEKILQQQQQSSQISANQNFAAIPLLVGKSDTIFFVRMNVSVNCFICVDYKLYRQQQWRLSIFHNLHIILYKVAIQSQIFKNKIRQQQWRLSILYSLHIILYKLNSLVL